MTKHLRFLIVLLMTLVWSTGGAQTTETITIADYVSTDDCKKIPVDAPLNKNGFKIYIEKKSTNTPGLYKSDKTLRLYSPDVLHIESSNGDITSVEFTPKSKNYFNIKDLTSNTWSGTPSASLSFTASGLNRFTVIKITYTESSSSNKTSTTLTFPKQSLTYATTDDLTSFTGQTATLTANGTTLTGKTITYSKSGDDIFSSFDATNGTLALNGNPGTATVTATFDGSNDDTYASSSASYTITVKEVIKDIATLKPLLTSSYKNFTLKLTDAIVTYKSGDVLYIQDNTAGIYCSGSTTLNNNDKVNGLVEIKARIYNGQRTITQWTLAEDATIEKDAAFTPEVVTLAQLNDNIDKYENMRVKVIGATANAAMSNNQTKLNQDGASLVLYSKVKSINWDFVADDVLDIEGYPVTYTRSSTNTKQLCVYKKGDVSINTSVVATTLSFDTTENAFNVFKGSESSFTAPKAVVKDVKGNVVAGAKITYESDAPTIASVDENGNVTFGSVFGEATITTSYAGDETHKPAKSISYTITYSKVPTVMAWSESSVSVNIGDELSAPTLTLTANGENILAGKTIQYSSSNENVAMIDPKTGDIVLMDKDGSTDITATFAGDDTYAEATAKYTLKVIDPNKTDVTFDFTDPSNFGYTEVRIELKEGDKLTKDDFVLENVQNGQNTTRLNKQLLRIYSGTNDSPKNGIVSLSAPAGFAINKIVFTDDNGNTNQVDNFKFSTGELKSKTWEGLANSITMEVVKNQVFLKQMIVYAVKVENVTLNESEINTIEAKTLANVTLKRTMKAGVWNTFCVPFSIDATQIASQFGEGTQIAKFVDSIDDEIQFAPLTSNEIVAGEPYLVKPINAADSYSFTNVSVAATDPITKGGGEYISFKGIYNPTDITKGLTANTFAAGIVGNVVKKAVSGSNMNGFRAFFIIPGGEGAPSSYMLKIDGTATSINTINGAEVVVDAPVYNLQGQRVDGNSLTPGIYVKAGKKFVVK